MVPLILIKTQLRVLRSYLDVTQCLSHLQEWLLLVHLMGCGSLTQLIWYAHVSILVYSYWYTASPATCTCEYLSAFISIYSHMYMWVSTSLVPRVLPTKLGRTLGMRLNQGLNHQVWSSQVRNACISTLQQGGLGSCCPKKFLKFGGYEIAFDTIFGSLRCSSEARRQSFTCIYEYLPFLPIASYNSFPIICKSDTLCRWGLRDYNRSLGRTESCWKEDLEKFVHFVHSHLASFNMSPMCLRALRGHLPSNGANWRCQANHRWGKK